jgi:hypothetical protein
VIWTGNCTGVEDGPSDGVAVGSGLVLGSGDGLGSGVGVGEGVLVETGVGRGDGVEPATESVFVGAGVGDRVGLAFGVVARGGVARVVGAGAGGSVGPRVGRAVGSGAGGTEGDGAADTAGGGTEGESTGESDGSLAAEGETGGSDAVVAGVAGIGVPAWETLGFALGAASGLALDGDVDGLATAAVIGSVSGAADWLTGTTVTAREGLHSRPGPNVAKAPAPITTMAASVNSGLRIADGSSMTGARQTVSGMCGGASDRSPAFPGSAGGWLADPERDSIVCLRPRGSSPLMAWIFRA